MTRFSILIPCYNCSKTLPDTLTSCLRQEFDGYEVILVDDCSRDNVENIYRHFLPFFESKNISLTYHRNSVNSGVSFSRNLAWDLSTGEYVCFLDSDDIWHESKLKIVNQVLNDDNCDCLYHSYTDQKDDFFTRRSFSDYASNELGLASLILKNPSQTSCFVLRRSIADRFDISMSFCEDYDLWLRIFCSHRIHALRGKPLTLLSRPQKTPGGLSASRKKMRLGELTAYLNFVQRNNKFKVLFPLLVVYSALKHIRSEIKYLVNFTAKKS